MDESCESNEQADPETQDADVESESAFESIPVGAGCVEIWERLAERREDD